MENLAKALVGIAALSLVVGVIAAGPMGGDIMGFPAESFSRAPHQKFQVPGVYAPGTWNFW